MTKKKEPCYYLPLLKTAEEGGKKAFSIGWKAGGTKNVGRIPNQQWWYAKWKLGWNAHTLHTFDANLYAQSALSKKISASELTWKFIKSVLLVGYERGGGGCREGGIQGIFCLVKVKKITSRNKLVFPTFFIYSSFLLLLWRFFRSCGDYFFLMAIFGRPISLLFLQTNSYYRAPLSLSFHGNDDLMRWHGRAHFLRQ